MHSIESLESRTLLDGGQPDLSFGDSGVATIQYAPFLDSGVTAVGVDVAQDQNGYVIVAGRDLRTTESKQIFLTRLTPAGDVDMNFGVGGTQVLPRRVDDSDSPEVAFSSSNQIYVRDHLVISRLTTRGKLDAGSGTTTGRLVRRSRRTSTCRAAVRSRSRSRGATTMVLKTARSARATSPSFYTMEPGAPFACSMPWPSPTARRWRSTSSRAPMWTSDDNGTYTIFSRGGEVIDVNGQRNESGAIGSFIVETA
jgi:hypothetical protein